VWSKIVGIIYLKESLLRLSYRLKPLEPRFVPSKEKKLLFPIGSRQPLGPTQLPIQRLPRKFSVWIMKLKTHIHLVLRLGMYGAVNPPIYLK